MNSPADIEIVVRYLGIIRLLTGRQTVVLTLPAPATVKHVAAALKQQLPPEVYNAIDRQTLLLSAALHQPGIVISWTEDAERMLQSGNCLTIVTPVTGG